MPVLFTVIGIVMLAAAIRDTVDGPNGLLSLLKSDLQGTHNFIFFIVAIFIIGGIGYIPMLKNVSRYLFALVLLVIFLANGGVWNKFLQALNGEQSASNTMQPSNTQNNSSTLNTVKDYAKQAATAYLA